MFIRALSGLVTRAETALIQRSNPLFVKSQMTTAILYKSGSSICQYMSRFAPFRWVVSKIIVNRAVETAWKRVKNRMGISG